MSDFPLLFQAGRIGSMEVKNRLVMPPMHSTMCSEDGHITDTVVNYLVARARGGVGLIISEASGITPDSQMGRWMMIFDDRFIPGLRRLVDAVHEAGARMAVQLWHPGVLSVERRRVFGGPGVQALVPTVLPGYGGPQQVREATENDIAALVEAYAGAARRAKEVGFDAVEFHGAHGYLINQFLSPRTNRRADAYGRTLEGRARFAVELLERSRQVVGPDFPLIFRMNGSDMVHGGITLSEAMALAPLLAQAGADALHVSASVSENGYIRHPTYMHPHGTFIDMAAAVRKVVDVPVIAVGKIHDPALAEAYLESGKADFLSLGRQLLADPNWPNKVREGRLEEIRRCIYCNIGCEDRDRNRWVGTTCTVNPAVGREEYFKLRPARTPRKVLVAGGGLAGMEAARIMAERGHTVTLYEATDRMGGQWSQAAMQDYKRDNGFPELTQQVIAGLKASGARVVLDTPVTRGLVEQESPEVVVVATGAKPILPDIPGVRSSNVVQSIDLIEDKAVVGKKIVVIGAGYMGMEAALSLAERGHQVTLLTRSMLGRNVGRHTRRALKEKLMEAGVYLYADSPAVEIFPDGVRVQDEGSGGGTPDFSFLPCDSVVLAVGAEAEGALAKSLRGVVPRLYTIGDCAQPRDLLDAMFEAWSLAYHLE